MKLLINFANQNLRQSQILNRDTGKKVGAFDEVISYSSDDIDSEFYKKNRKILINHRGDEYSLWKPYFIKKALNMLRVC